MLKKMYGKGALLSFLLIALLGISASAFAGTTDTKPAKAKTTAVKKTTKKKVVKKKRHHHKKRHHRRRSTKNSPKKN